MSDVLNGMTDAASSLLSGFLEIVEYITSIPDLGYWIGYTFILVIFYGFWFMVGSLIGKLIFEKSNHKSKQLLKEAEQERKEVEDRLKEIFSDPIV